MSLCRATHTPIVYEEIPARLRNPAEKKPEFDCDLCGETFDGPPAGSGLFLWTRGTEIRFEEPPLCEECAGRVTVGALFQWALEDEE